MGDVRMTAKLTRAALSCALIFLGTLLLAKTADGCGFASLWRSSSRENNHHVAKRALPVDTPSEWGNFLPQPVEEKQEWGPFRPEPAHVDEQEEREERQLTKQLKDVLCMPSCVNGDCIGANTCLCHEGYHGYTCENALCNPECMNGGVCTAPYQCECPSGYKGDRCQTAVCSPPCENGGACTQPNVCTCPPGYKGNHCATPVCTNGCQNGGLCVAPEQCSCMDGWAGKTCETPSCDEPCLHGGTCIAPNQCACVQHYGGTRCQYSLFENDAMQQFGAASTHPGRVCSAWSGRHFLTFDGRYFDFPAHADCSYLLAGDCIDYNFNVMVREDGECTVDRCTLRIDLRIRDTDVTIQHKDGHHVTVNDKRVSLPYSYQGINVESTGAYVRLYSAIGVMVSWDGHGSVYVELDADHHNKTCGLCGNFNGIDADDYRSRSGELLHNTMEFGNNWRMTGADETCPFVPFDTPGTCAEIPRDELQELFEICSVLSESADFRPCRNAMDPTPYVHACVSDLCSCAYESRDECLCGALTQYSRACAHSEVVLSWRSQDFCWHECPAGKMYEECGTACPRTCRNLDSSYACAEHCVDGCFCPTGTVHHGNECVPETNCTCLHNGREYQPGQTTRQGCNQCYCEGGKWTCTELDCPATCSATGDPHYVSFDGRRFTFMGDCQYVLAKDCGSGLFSVYTENLPCGLDSAVTCTKTGTIVLKSSGKDVMVTFHQGGAVSVANVGVTLPYVQDDIIIHRSSSMFVTLTSSIGLIVEWDGETRMYVTVSPDFKGKTCGLCGNFNGNQLDDFTVKGLPETSVAAFGNSWKANADCLDVPRDQILEACAVNTQRADYANSMCGVINSPLFAVCHRVVRPEPYFKECLFDVCECELGERCLCSAIANYARVCARNHAPVEWRSPELCPVECSGGQELQQCGSSCRATCRSLSDPIQGCDDECVEGCNCPQGLYLDEDDNCVLPSECPCYHHGELYRPNEAIHRKGSTCYCQDGVMECYDSSVQPTENTAVKGLPNREGRFAMCIPPFFFFSCYANPGSKGTECRPTCQNMHIIDQCISNQCISGCMCAGGLVQDGYECVLPYECPCHHNGQSYQSGETIQMDCNQCTCQGGDWQCTTHGCSGTCTAYGDSHYITFDGYRYQFYGSCAYEFATDFCGGAEGTFRVQVQNERCGLWGATCIKSITITLQTVQIIFYKDRPGEPEVRPLPGIHDPCVNVVYNFRRVGFFLILTTEHGLTVMWDFGTRVYVKLSPEFRGNVCGLCGNFDGNQANDFTTRALDIAVQPEEFASSWQVNPLCLTTLDNKDDQNNTALWLSPCLINLHRVPWARRQCAVIHASVFQPCHATIDPQPWYDACVDDTCSCDMGGDCECFCTAVAAYAHACGEAGIPIRWRTPELCPTQCEDYNAEEVDCVWHYHPCGRPCEETCQNQEWSECSLPCLAGCHPTCPNGTLLNEYTRECVEVCPTSLPVIVPSCTTTPAPETTTLVTTPVSETTTLVTTPVSETTTLVTQTSPVTRTTPVSEVTSTTPGTTTGTTPTRTPEGTTTTVPPSTVPPCCEWSEWMNSDNIIDTTDNETYPHLREHYYSFCQQPDAIQCRTVDVNSEGQHLNVAQAGQVGVVCDASVGLLCLGELQLNTYIPVCFDYEVRVLCCDLCTTTESARITTAGPSTTQGGTRVTTIGTEISTIGGGPEVTTQPGGGSQEVTTQPGGGSQEVTTQPGGGSQEVTTQPGGGSQEVTTQPGGGSQEVTTQPGGGSQEVTTQPGGGSQEVTTQPGGGSQEVTTQPGGGSQEVTTQPGGGSQEVTTQPEGGSQEVTTQPGGGSQEVTTQPGGGSQEVTTQPGGGSQEVTTQPGGGSQEVTTQPGGGSQEVTTQPGGGSQEVTTQPGGGSQEVTTQPGGGSQEVTTQPGGGSQEVTTQPGGGSQEVTTQPGGGSQEVTTQPGGGSQEVTTQPGGGSQEVTTQPGGGSQEVTTQPGGGSQEVTTQPGGGSQEVTTQPGGGSQEVTTQPGGGSQEVTTQPGGGSQEVTTQPGGGSQEVTTQPGGGSQEVTTQPGGGSQEVTTQPGGGSQEVTTQPGGGSQEVTTQPGGGSQEVTTQPGGGSQEVTTQPGGGSQEVTTQPGGGSQEVTTQPGGGSQEVTTQPGGGSQEVTTISTETGTPGRPTTTSPGTTPGSTTRTETGTPGIPTTTSPGTTPGSTTPTTVGPDATPVPTCPPCYFHGNVYPSGEWWTFGCKECTCECGQVVCQPVQCPPVPVPTCENGANPEEVMDPYNPCCWIWQCPPESTTSVVSTEGTTSVVSTEGTRPTPTPTCPPCYVNGNVIPSGEWWTNTITACTECTCLCGQVQCQPLQCPAVTVPECVNGAEPEYVEDPDNPCCRTWQCPCDCFLYGEPHYSTCDGRRFSHQGNCTYLMASPIGSDEFEIWAQNFPCSGAKAGVATCTRSVTVLYGGFEVELGRTGWVIVNGQPMRPPVTVGGMTITRHGYHTMRVVIDALGVIVNYIELNYIASIYIPPEFFEDIEGLCGFYDNDQSNDFTLTDGTVTTDTEEFGYDWLVDSELEDCYINDTVCVLGNVTTPCDILATDVFEPCHDLVDYHQYLEDCEFDVCFETSPCFTITAYAMACLAHGVCIDWRDLVPECPSQCPPDRIYTPCGTTCPVTCQDQTVSCGSGFMEDCACPDGFVLDVTTGDCILSTDCACVDHNNVPHQPGESWNEGPCRVCTCEETSSGDYIETCQDITSCPTSCPPCHTLVNSPGTCCGECVPTSCCEVTSDGSVIDHAVNSTWSPGDDACEVCECRELATTGEAFEVCSTIHCPNPGPTHCDEGNLVTEPTDDGCCSISHCVVEQTGCVRYENQTQLTVNGCTSSAPVTISWCEGRCPSGSYYLPESNSFEQHCGCCGPDMTETNQVELACSDGTWQTHFVTKVVSCNCNGTC
ncbi:mucin-2-like isoform X2 [Branchiostoma floridae]|uniref:Mucin-2-like isoform X2 n=1 Tax=Branchiostoma floridae TaxID=7739 RepID=A0A9J7LKQ0_BRAFL|nr:mucin-2-like isoform X2 [Branchiostoma floridae]